MNNGVFGKIMKNVRKQRDVKLVTTERKRNYLVSEPNYQTYQKFFIENLLAIEMGKTQILMNKPVYLGLSILDLSKTVMYQFWYDYPKPEYGENAKLIGLMINERWIRWTNMKEFVGLRAKTCRYLKDNNDEDKKEKGTKKCVVRRKYKFQDRKSCFEAARIENNINHSEKK